jgi:hypothetical protein
MLVPEGGTMFEAAAEDRPQSLVGFASPPRIFSGRGHVRDCQPRGRFQVCSPTPIRGGISARANLAFDQRFRRWSNGFLWARFRGIGTTSIGSSSRLGKHSGPVSSERGARSCGLSSRQRVAGKTGLEAGVSGPGCRVVRKARGREMRLVHVYGP